MNRKMMKALTPPKDAIMSEMWSGKLFHISKNQVANVVNKKSGHPNNWIGHVQVQKHASNIR